MKSVGEVIKESRQKKRFSRETLEEKTKIKKEFIESLENSRWSALPEYPVVLGFVKNIADALDLKEEKLTALLRRDYPPKDLTVNPKPELRERFKWGPRLTFTAAIFLVLVAIFIYLGISYLNFVKPPFLELEEPGENQSVTGSVVSVRGKTNSEAVVVVNNQPLLVNEDGCFEAEIEVSDNTREVLVIAKSRSGKETIIRRKIKVSSDEVES